LVDLYDNVVSLADDMVVAEPKNQFASSNYVRAVNGVIIAFNANPSFSSLFIFEFFLAVVYQIAIFDGLILASGVNTVVSITFEYQSRLGIPFPPPPNSSD
jgi:hypothetical protein